MKRVGFQRKRGLVAAGTMLALFLILAGVGSVASAARSTTPRSFLVGTGLLCEEESPCPDIAMADNGDFVELAGSGMFNPATRAASGDGTFVHHFANGDVFASGTWDVVSLVSFKSYGTIAGDDVTLEGGLALIRVAIHPSELPDATFSGILTVDCLIGNAPAGADEGVRLNVQDLINFNTEVSGETLFLQP